MKKFIIILMILLAVVCPIFANNYTEEEFKEVYNALEETNKLLKEKQEEVNKLYDKIDLLMDINKQLSSELIETTSSLENTVLLLDTARKDLTASNKVINSLNNKNIIIGAHIGLNNWVGLREAPIIGYGATLGFKVSLGYLLGQLSFYNDKSYTITIGYSFIL